MTVLNCLYIVMAVI